MVRRRDPAQRLVAMTTATRPELPLANLRDLGGIRVAEGCVRSGRVFRSDDVAVIDRDGAEQLLATGVTTILDLRSTIELERWGRGHLGDLGTAHVLLPLQRISSAPHELRIGLPLEAVTPESMGRWYVEMVLDAADLLVEGLRVTADADGAVLFHCAAGKDRTGVFAAALLAVLGADAAAIAADYTLTQTQLRPLLTRLSVVFPTDDQNFAGLDWDNTPGAMLSAPSETMLAMLRILDEEHGGMLSVLRRAGLDAITEATLRERLVDRSTTNSEGVSA